MVGASMPPRGRVEGEEKQIQQVEATAADETGREWPDFYLLISRVRELLSLCRCLYRPLQNTRGCLLRVASLLCLFFIATLLVARRRFANYCCDCFAFYLKTARLRFTRRQLGLSARFAQGLFGRIEGSASSREDKGGQGTSKDSYSFRGPFATSGRGIASLACEQGTAHFRRLPKKAKSYRSGSSVTSGTSDNLNSRDRQNAVNGVQHPVQSGTDQFLSSDDCLSEPCSTKATRNEHFAKCFFHILRLADS